MVKYVKDFEFSSSGPKQVRGYMRGGASCGYAKGGAAKKSTPPVMAVPIGKKSDAKMPVKKAMGGSMMGAPGAPGAGAVSDKEIKTLKKVAMPILAKVAKARSAAKPAGPSRAQFDAMMAARNAAPVITPRQRRAMNNETMIGRKTGGSVKC